MCKIIYLYIKITDDKINEIKLKRKKKNILISKKDLQFIILKKREIKRYRKCISICNRSRYLNYINLKIYLSNTRKI